MNDKSLAEFIETVLPESHLRIEADLGDGFVRLKSDEAQRRQAIQDIRCVEDAVIEVLRNSRDAGATKLFLSLAKEANNRKVILIDNGSGIPPKMHQAVFEPLVTSKLDTAHIDKWGVHGRGMALFSIKYNTDNARIIESDKGLGTALGFDADTSKLKERSDQSQFPKFEFNDTGKVLVTGPKNILRNACEFALEHRQALQVYVGSPSEIIATMYDIGCKEVSFSERCRKYDTDTTPLYLRPCYAADADELMDISQSLGFNISTRTASRILNDEIQPCESLVSMVEYVIQHASQSHSEKETAKNSNPNKPYALPHVEFSQQDTSTFITDIQKSYAKLAEKYYLDTEVSVSLRKVGNTLHLTILLQDNQDNQ